MKVVVSSETWYGCASQKTTVFGLHPCLEYKYRGADKSLARPTSQCHRTESIVLCRKIIYCSDQIIYACCSCQEPFEG